MKRKFPRWPVFILSLGCIISIATSYPYIKRRLLINSYLTAKPIKPFILDQNVWQWDYKLLLDSNISIQIKACTIQTIMQRLKYSDETDPRSLPNGSFVDYTIQEIRIDPKLKILYMRTSDNIWGGYKNRNSFIFKYDLIKRKTVAQCEISPKLLPSSLRP